MKNYRIRQVIGLIVFVLSVIQVNSQEIITKKDALQIALANNYGVKVAKNSLEVAENNSSIYNSGYLPTLSGSAGANYNNSNQRIERQDGTSSEVNGAETETYNASIGLNYTIFDGLGRKYNYHQLKETYNLTELQARETIENMYLQLFTSYFQVARLTKNTQNLKETLEVSKKRLKRAKYQYDFGQSTKLEWLNAQVDVNNDSINYVNSIQSVHNAQRNLNVVLGVQRDTNYQVETTVEFIDLIAFDALYNKALENNVLLNQLDKNIAINQLNEKISKSNYLPTLGLSTSYGWNKSNNPATSFLAASKSTGFNAGLNLSWNLFDGGITKTRIANAKIAIENQQILKEQQRNILENNLKNAYESYKNALFVLVAQEQNLETNTDNFKRTEERYKLGQVTSIEFRQAQVNLLNAQNALNNAKYDSKLLELTLLQLSGEILNTKI